MPIWYDHDHCCTSNSCPGVYKLEFDNDHSRMTSLTCGYVFYRKCCRRARKSIDKSHQPPVEISAFRSEWSPVIGGYCAASSEIAHSVGITSNTLPTLPVALHWIDDESLGVDRRCLSTYNRTPDHRRTTEGLPLIADLHRSGRSLS